MKQFLPRFLRLLKWTSILTVAFYGIVLLTPFRSALPGYHYFYYTPARYTSKLTELQERRLKLQLTGDKTQAAVLMRKSISDELFPFWEGTRWNFNGTTETPGRGSIACGYFVTTLLRDIGVPVKRETYAQMASEQMIKELVQEPGITRYSNVKMDTFIRSVKSKGNQLYLLGLDNHTGFLVVENEQVYFIHSSGRFPWAVVKEDAATSIVISKSKYRVTGCISGDDKLLQAWMENRKKN